MSDEIECIVGVDPGAATGLCRVFPAIGFEAMWTMTHFEACDWLVSTIEYYGPRLVIPCEDFRPRQGVTYRSESTEVIGVLKWAAWKYGAKLAIQEVSDAKMFVDNERLKLIGWYSRSGQSPHARDAARHVLLYLARCGMFDGSQIRWGNVSQTT